MCCSSYFFSGCVSYVVLVLVRTLLAVSAWNDNGQTQFVHDSGKSDFGCSRDSWPGIFRTTYAVALDIWTYFLSFQLHPHCIWNGSLLILAVVHTAEVLYRSDFFPGLGWMLTKAVWDELAPQWPNAYPFSTVVYLLFIQKLYMLHICGCADVQTGRWIVVGTVCTSLASVTLTGMIGWDWIALGKAATSFDLKFVVRTTMASKYVLANSTPFSFLVGYFYYAFLYLVGSWYTQSLLLSATFTMMLSGVAYTVNHSANFILLSGSLATSSIRHHSKLKTFIPV